MIIQDQQIDLSLFYNVVLKATTSPFIVHTKVQEAIFLVIKVTITEIYTKNSTKPC
ncbi:hypothetical protein [Aureispira anguillae]|uniref:Uncharacterized protein n=1 Tax=Aureispira anguillae TaxID=2864201 RepID=A0A915YFP1_9BACT|nr:hypothetical protein [Aureispira anguillae]BDS12169.1 hypothetical protein AsAng_0028840 [Aureispira anguillae]